MKSNCFILIVLLFFLSCSKESAVVESDQDGVFSDSQSDLDAIDDDVDHEHYTDVVVNDTESSDKDILGNDEDIDEDNPKEYTINWGTEKDDIVTGAYLTKDGKTLHIMGYSSDDGLHSFPADNPGFVLTVDMEKYLQTSSVDIATTWNFLFDESKKDFYTVEYAIVDSMIIATLGRFDENWQSIWTRQFTKQQSDNLSIYPSVFPALFLHNDIIVTGRDGDTPFVIRYTNSGDEMWRRNFPYFGSIESCVSDENDVIYCSGFVNPQSFESGIVPDTFPILTRPFFVILSETGEVLYEKIIENKNISMPHETKLFRNNDDLWMLYSDGGPSGCFISILNKDGSEKYPTRKISGDTTRCYIRQGIVKDPFGALTIIRQEYTQDNGNDIFLSWHDDDGTKIDEMRVQGNRDESYFYLFYYNEGETKKRYIVGSSNSDEFSYNGSDGDYDIFIMVYDFMR